VVPALRANLRLHPAMAILMMLARLVGVTEQSISGYANAGRRKDPKDLPLAAGPASIADAPAGGRGFGDGPIADDQRPDWIDAEWTVRSDRPCICWTMRGCNRVHQFQFMSRYYFTWRSRH
jgi:hypothetical protein